MVRYLPLCVLLLIFCNEDPAGEDIIDHYRDLGLLVIDTLTPIEIENSYSDLPNGYGSNLVLGIDSEYEARVLLKFQIPDTDYTDIDSVKLILDVNDFLKNEEVEFEIRLVTTEWNEAEVRWLAASEGLRWQSPGGDFGDTIIYSGKASKDSILVRIDPELFSDIKSTYGFILIPKDGGPLAFSAGSARFFLISNGEWTIFDLTGDSFIVNCLRFPEEGEYFLGSGYTFRDYLKFDIDTRYQEFWLARADLEVKILSHRSMQDSISYGLRSLKEEFSGIKTEIRDYDHHYLPIADSTLIIDVLKIVHYWVENPDSNYGAFLTLFPEDSDITRLMIDPDSIKLHLYLVNKPEGRF